MSALFRLLFTSLPVALAIAVVQPVVGQPRFPSGNLTLPLFRTKKDSVYFYQVENNILRLLNSLPVDEFRIDSLQQLRAKLFEETVVGFKTLYRPSPGFILLDSLRKVEDHSSVTKVSLSAFAGKTLPPEILKCMNLEVLELLDTRLESIPGSVGELKHLKTLFVYNNRSGRRLRLEKNNTITRLVIRSDDHKQLPKNFRPFSALHVLDLQENRLEKFPRGARHNKKLRELLLQHNSLSLRGGLRNHKYLENLSLQYNRIKTVPRGIRKFSNLKKLNLNYNEINDVHPAIGRLKNLEQLSFYHNRLKKIPKDMGALPKLREIDLFYNELEELPFSEGQWPALRMLYLSHNRLTSLPDPLEQLDSLEGIFVWDNRLQKLPENLGNLPAIKFIWANNNYLKELPPSLWQNNRIEELEISHNEITCLPDEVFQWPVLRILRIVNNPWDESTRKRIGYWVGQLRAKGVFVHITGEEE